MRAPPRKSAWGARRSCAEPVHARRPRWKLRLIQHRPARTWVSRSTWAGLIGAQQPAVRNRAARRICACRRDRGANKGDEGQMPKTPDELMRYLAELDIEVTTHHHPPLFTVAESRSLRGEIPGA